MDLRGSLVAVLIAVLLGGILVVPPAPVRAQNSGYEDDDYDDYEDSEDSEDSEDEEDEEDYDDRQDAGDEEDADEEDADVDDGAEGSYDHVAFDLHALFNYYLAAGLGLRVDLPVVPQGLLHGSDDDLRISLGADVEWFFGDTEKSGIGVIPVLAFQWNFYLNEKWSIFPELGAALLFVPKRDRILPSFLGPQVALGVRHHFNQYNAFLFRVGWPTGIQIGLTF